MMTEEVVNEVVHQLGVAYLQAGGHISADNALTVAKSFCESLDFADVTEVQESFRRAKLVQDIPTLRTLAEALRNHRAESPMIATDTDVKSVEFRDKREAWLPKEWLRKRINLTLAIKNYCAACGDEKYMEYCRTHRLAQRASKDAATQFLNEEAALKFDAPIKETLRHLYTRYWRRLPMSQGYPEDAKLNLGLTPPTVPQFRVMIDHEMKLDAQMYA